MISKKNKILSILFGMFLSVQAIGQDSYGEYRYSGGGHYGYQNDCCFGLTVYGDGLYWRARGCELDYAAELKAEGDLLNISLFTTGKVHSIDPGYKGAFRVGISQEFNCYFFDASYTRFHDRETAQFTKNLLDLPIGVSPTQIPNNLFINLGIDPDGVPLFGAAHAKWNLDYDVVDILAGYNLCSCNCFQTFIFGGLKLAYIDQLFDLRYDGQFQSATPETFIISIKEKVDLDAYGVDLGLGVDYSFRNCFNFFGNFSYDILLGYFKRSVNQNFLTQASTLINYIDNLQDSCWAPVSVANLKFGVGYRIQNLFLSVGYEFHLWMNMLSFLKVQDAGFVNVVGAAPGAHTDMTFDKHFQSFEVDGVVVRAGLSF